MVSICMKYVGIGFVVRVLYFFLLSNTKPNTILK